MYIKTYMEIFSHIFKMVTPRTLRQFLLFIALNCLTDATFIANLCSHLIPAHYNTGTTLTSKHTCKIRCCIDKKHELANNKVFHKCDQNADPDCAIMNFCRLNMKNF